MGWLPSVLPARMVRLPCSVKNTVDVARWMAKEVSLRKLGRRISAEVFEPRAA